VSDWFVTPPIENAVLILATIPTCAASNDPDEEADFPGQPDWASTWRLIQSLSEAGETTPYLFFDPPDCEDDMESLLASADHPCVAELAVAAQPFGPLSQRISHGLRRIFARNDTKRAVAVLSNEAFANPNAIYESFVSLQNGADAVIGLDSQSRLSLFGSRSYEPSLLEGLSLWESCSQELSPGVRELLQRAKKLEWTVEILPMKFA
jgi:hypothetical protein